MPDPRFLQIHFLAPYTAALLNRDDLAWPNACHMAVAFAQGFPLSA